MILKYLIGSLSFAAYFGDIGKLWCVSFKPHGFSQGLLKKQKVELTHCNDLGYWIGKVMDQDIEQSLRSLLSDEHLDRDSPDLWSDPSFGYNVKFSPAPSAVATPGSSKWQDESQNDREILIQELASLTKEEVLKKVRDLQNFAYQLGSEEGIKGYHTFSKTVIKPPFLNDN
ncbi:uncharacterized protein TRIADDRAFT_61351 [Trichoplax adhaerens]|uniref:Uncharacterized protein n=1 Tax=Trichoplax adhaerens TaxID=10228 RepID=B3SAR3_TRIAD|nr:hypothetical protein TRIADDRAFT_61351 [Trichoplax adhaerens]EDV20146.1 hypothetical protein TRIADDRAFT_61351 [Trichoplax adhaerens]|eukprot:XP_002117307.1 hypothetical protein TRIADDRAFT_61351 [Trichoplax adhaerens]